MRKCFLLYCIIFWTNAPRAQDIERQIDSLLHLLERTEAYDNKLNILSELSDKYSYSDSAKSIRYAMQMKQLAGKHRDKRGEAFAYFRMAGAHLDAFDLENARKFYNQAVSILENDTSVAAQTMLGKAWSNLGLTYQREGNLHKQLEYLKEKTIPINERLEDTLNLGRNYHNIGIIFQTIKEYETALDYYKKSGQMLDRYDGVPEIPDNFVKIVECMLFLNVKDEMRDSALSLLDKAGDVIRRHPDMMSETLHLQALGMCYEYFDLSLVQADQYYERAALVAQKSKVMPLVGALNLRRFYVQEKQQNYAAALSLLEDNYKNYLPFLTTHDKLLHVRYMMQMQEKLGNIKAALALHKNYNMLSDSIHAGEMTVKVQELEQKYAAKEKETQIIKLQQVAQEQQMQIERNRQWVFYLTIAMLSLIGFFIARQNINRKKNEIARQQAELLEQRIEKMKQEQQLRHLGAVLEGQELERKRLASDLHDGLGGALSGIRLKLSRLIQDNTTHINENNAALKGIAGELDLSINDLRHIARNMMPESLLKYGLTAAIKDFCRSMETQKTKISFQAFDVNESKMLQSIQIMIFRILQELITNTTKHAEANNILAQLLQQQNTVFITVEDDGKGFDTRTNYEGMGLTTLKDRVRFLGGKLEIHSEKGIGTTTNIEFEIKDESTNRNSNR